MIGSRVQRIPLVFGCPEATKPRRPTSAASGIHYAPGAALTEMLLRRTADDRTLGAIILRASLRSRTACLGFANGFCRNPGDRSFGRVETRGAEAIATMAEFTKHVAPAEGIDAVPSDPDDNRILEYAVAADSEVIVTGDLDLLRLGSFRGTARPSSSLTRQLIQPVWGIAVPAPCRGAHGRRPPSQPRRARTV